MNYNFTDEDIEMLLVICIVFTIALSFLFITAPHDNIYNRKDTCDMIDNDSYCSRVLLPVQIGELPTFRFIRECKKDIVCSNGTFIPYGNNNGSLP